MNKGYVLVFALFILLLTSLFMQSFFEFNLLNFKEKDNYFKKEISLTEAENSLTAVQIWLSGLNEPPSEQNKCLSFPCVSSSSLKNMNNKNALIWWQIHAYAFKNNTYGLIQAIENYSIEKAKVYFYQVNIFHDDAEQAISHVQAVFKKTFDPNKPPFPAERLSWIQLL